MDMFIRYLLSYYANLGTLNLGNICNDFLANCKFISAII